MSPRRQAGPEWPRVLCPATGCLPPIVPLRKTERIVHLSWRYTDDMQTGLTRSLQSCASEYRIVDTDSSLGGSMQPDVLRRMLFKAAEEIRPTLIWVQVHKEGILRPDDIRRLRSLSDPELGVTVLWDGDQHFEPHDEQRRWFVELGKVFDASLLVNVKHPYEYAKLGVRHPGYLQAGFDEHIWRPVEPMSGVPEVVFLANYWQSLAHKYTNRFALARAVANAFPGRFGVYGRNWEQYPGLPGKPYLRNEDEAVVYSSAKAALSISIRNDLPRYTSNRLVYGSGCGALMVVETFPDYEGVGLEHGKNCLVFDGAEELVRTLNWVLEEAKPEELHAIRSEAAAVGALHSWQAHIPELLAMVDAIREGRHA